MQASRDALALVAATYVDNRPGLEWRALQDTTNDPVVARRQPKPYRGYQMSADYYSGGQLMWLEADARIRTLRHLKKPLHDSPPSSSTANAGHGTPHNPHPSHP